MGLKNILLKRSIRVSKRYSLGLDKRFHSFDTAHTVGILFLLEELTIPKEMQNLLVYLKQKRLSYFALGYYDNSNNPTNFISTNKVAVFNKTDMNWYNKPTSEKVETFLHQNYDIVIDLCRKKVAPLQYLASCVNASTLIGGHFYEGCPYDLIVDAKQTCDTAGYIEQVKHYLSAITPPQET